jgi:hypothetical protein
MSAESQFEMLAFEMQDDLEKHEPCRVILSTTFWCWLLCNTFLLWKCDGVWWMDRSRVEVVESSRMGYVMVV